MTADLTVLQPCLKDRFKLWQCVGLPYMYRQGVPRTSRLDRKTILSKTCGDWLTAPELERHSTTECDPLSEVVVQWFTGSPQNHQCTANEQLAALWRGPQCFHENARGNYHSITIR